MRRCPAIFSLASPRNSFQDRVARGIHHFITSSGQKAKGNLGRGSSAMVIGTGCAATSAVAVIMGLRVLGALRRAEAAFLFFFL